MTLDSFKYHINQFFYGIVGRLAVMFMSIVFFVVAIFSPIKALNAMKDFSED
jgi:hypothetical protein